MSLTIEKLHAELTKMLENGADPDMEVRVAIQPTWPMEITVCDQMVVSEEEDEMGNGQPVHFYLAEERHCGYADSDIVKEFDL